MLNGEQGCRPFGENFHVGEPVMCPLCETHLDNPVMSLQCPGVYEESNAEHSLEGIFANNISQETVESIQSNQIHCLPAQVHSQLCYYCCLVLWDAWTFLLLLLTAVYPYMFSFLFI